MAFFHLKTVPGQGWPPLPDSVFAQVWNAYLELDRTQWLDRAEIEQRQLTQVRTLLTHCIANVPYYRQALAGIKPASIQTMDDFRRFPLLLRRVYQEQNASFVATKLPPGTIATTTTQTSGSSGTPTDTHHTNMTQLWWHAFFLRDLEWCNFDPTGTLAAIRFSERSTRKPREAVMRCWSLVLDPLIESAPTFGIDLHQDPREQLRSLRRIAPNYLLGYGASLEALALLAGAEGPIPSLRGIQSISTNLSAEAQATIEKAFGVPVKNTYSCNEAGYLASPCPDGPGLHVHAENVLLEVLDEQGRPCAPGETGAVYLTVLHNLRGPLIRYEVGDQVTLAPAPCPCGRGLPLLTDVLGKQNPLFCLPDGSRRHATALASLLRGIGGYWQQQLIQKAADHVVLRLAVVPGWTEQKTEAMTQAIRQFFGAPIRVDVEILDHLPLPRSGKFQGMINEIPAT